MGDYNENINDYLWSEAVLVLLVLMVPFATLAAVS
jgi:hypothetical protein